MEIRELMTKEVMVVREDTTVERLTKLFAKHKITGSPVINEEGELIGVVSLSDLFRTPKRKSADDDSHEFYVNPSWSFVHHDEPPETTAKVRDIMTHLVIYVEAGEDIERAADLMVIHGIHRIVVTDQGKVVGMITSADMVREFRERLKAAKQPS